MKCHLLLLSTLTVIRGIFAVNTCLQDCQVDSRGALNLSSCGITDDDIAAGDLATCFDNAGRADITGPLGLTNNAITTFPPSIFDGLPSAAALTLGSNQIVSLPPGIFDSLSSATSLILQRNNLTTLPAGIFDQLSSLTFMVISLNDLECLPSARTDPYVVSDDIPDPGICGCTLADGTNPCGEEACTPGEDGFTCGPLCPNGEAVCDDPHMQGLRGQKIDWSGVDGGWYALIHGDDVSINVRLTAPLPDDFPDRQLVTGLSVLSQGHALTVEVKNPYDIATDGCPDGVSPCLADGGLRIIVDEEKVENTLLLRTSSRELPVADGAFLLSASNLPVECRQFGGDKIWARMYDEWMRGTRDLASGDISFEAWMTSFDRMAAPDWCVKYIAENDLIDLQSTHAIFKIETSTGVTVRLNAGVNFQGGGERDWDERVLPDLEFWQMGVGVDGLDIEDPALSGILGETARPVFDENGKAVMEGFEAFRGIVEDYRVSSALGSRFALLDTAEGRFE